MDYGESDQLAQRITLVQAERGKLELELELSATTPINR